MPIKFQHDFIEMLRNARFEEKKEELDFSREECPSVFDISNTVSHIRIESEVAWDGPRFDDVWRTAIP